MGLLKFGLCIVTWILCASKTSGNNTTLLNSGSECIEGEDLPLIGPCKNCVCTQGKVFCIDVECGLTPKQNETRSGPGSNTIHEKKSPAESNFNETRRYQIDVINKQPNNNGLPYSSVITLQNTGKETPNISMILSKTHADNVFKTFLSKSNDSDKYILIIPEVFTNSAKKNLQKRDVSLIEDMKKNKLNSEFGQQPLQQINFEGFYKDNSEPKRRHSQQPLNNRPLRSNHYSNQHKMVSSRLEKKQVSKQHNTVSSHMQKRSNHYQMSQSQSQKKRSKFKFSFKSQSQYKGNSFQGTRITRAPNINLHTPDESFPFPQSKYIEPDQPVFKKPAKKLQQPVVPGGQYSKPFNPGANSPVKNRNKNPFSRYPKYKHKLRPNMPKYKPKNMFKPLKPIKIVKPYNSKKPFDLILQVLKDISAIYPDIENIPPLSDIYTPQSKTPLGKIPKSLYGPSKPKKDPKQSYPKNHYPDDNEPRPHPNRNKRFTTKVPKIFYDKPESQQIIKDELDISHNYEEYMISENTLHKKKSSKIKKLLKKDKRYTKSPPLGPVPKKSLPKLPVLDNFSSQQMLNEELDSQQIVNEELAHDYEEYLNSENSLQKKPTSKIPPLNNYPLTHKKPAKGNHLNPKKNKPSVMSLILDFIIKKKKPKRPDDKSEQYPDYDDYLKPNDKSPSSESPFYPTKPNYLSPKKYPYEPKNSDDYSPNKFKDEEEMYLDYENYDYLNKSNENNKKNPLSTQSPYKPKRPYDYNPDKSDYIPDMKPAYEDYPTPIGYPSKHKKFTTEHPFHPNKGSKPTKYPYEPGQGPNDFYPDEPEIYPNVENIPKPKKYPYKPKQPDDTNPDSHYPEEPEMYPGDENYPIPDKYPLAPFFPNKGKQPPTNTPQLLKPLPKKSPYKPKRPDDSSPDSHYPEEESETYPGDEHYPIPDNHPWAPFFPSKGKKPTGKIPQLFNKLPKKSPYKPKRPDNSNPDSRYPGEPETYPDDENYPIPDNHPLAPFLPKIGKQPISKIPQLLKPLLDKLPHKPKRPDDSNPDSHYPEEPEMYPDDGNYPIPDNHPLAPHFPNKGKQPIGKIPQLLKPLLDKLLNKPKRPDDSNPESHYPEEPELYPNDENYPIPDNHPLAPFLPKKSKQPIGKIPQLLKPLLDKLPHKPKRPDDSNPDSHYPEEPEMYPDDGNYPIPDNHPLAPHFPNKGKQPIGKIPQLLKPLLDKLLNKPKRPDDSNPESHYPEEPELYPNDENYPIPDNHPLAPFLPKKSKEPIGKIPQLLKPLLDKLPHKPKRPDDSNPDSHYPEEPEMYPDDGNYPIPDNHPLAPHFPNKGKQPIGKIPQLLKPLLDKLLNKPKRPGDSNPESHYPEEPELYPDDENYPIPDNHPSAPFFPSKGKKPTTNIPDLLKPLPKKSPYKPKRPDDFKPDSHYPEEPEMYPDDENYPIPDNHPLAPFFPKKGKHPTGKIPQLLKPLLDKLPHKPKRPDDSNPDSHYPEEPEMYPDDGNYPIPDNHPLAPHFPNKGKQPIGKIPQLLKPLLDKLLNKPERPGDSNPESHYPKEPELYPDDENYPIPDNHPLAPFFPNKGKKPTGMIPELLKPLLDKLLQKPKRPDDSNPESHYPEEPELYPDDENYPIPDNHPSAPFFPSKGKKPTTNIPDLLKPLPKKSPYKPKRPDDFKPDSHYPEEPEMYPDDENYPIPDNHPLAPFSPKKGKQPTGTIPQSVKPLLDKLPHKPKRPDDSNPDSHYPEEPEMYPYDGNYPTSPDNYPLAPFFPNKGKKPKRPDDVHPDFHSDEKPEINPDVENIPNPKNYPNSETIPEPNKYPNSETMPKPKKYPNSETIPKPKKYPYTSEPEPEDSHPDILHNESEKNQDYDNYLMIDEANSNMSDILKPSPKKSPHKPKRPDDFNPDSHHSAEPEMYPDDENLPIPVPTSVPDKSAEKPICKIICFPNNKPADNSHEPSSDYNLLLSTTPQYEPIFLSDNTPEPQFFPLFGDEKPKNIPISFSENSQKPLKLSFKPFGEENSEYRPNSLSERPNQLFGFTTPFYIKKPLYGLNILSDNSLEQPFKFSTPFSPMQPVYKPNSFLDNISEQSFKFSTPFGIKPPLYRPNSIYNNIPEHPFQFSTPFDVENPRYGVNSISNIKPNLKPQDTTSIKFSKKEQHFKFSNIFNVKKSFKPYRPSNNRKWYAPQ